MNRVVEFRGMRTDNKRWVYGYYIVCKYFSSRTNKRVNCLYLYKSKKENE